MAPLLLFWRGRGNFGVVSPLRLYGGAVLALLFFSLPSSSFTSMLVAAKRGNSKGGARVTAAARGFIGGL